MFRIDEGHEALMRQSLLNLKAAGFKMPAAVDEAWLTLGNVRTDIPAIDLDRHVSWWEIVKAIWRGTTCFAAEHPAHAMRCRGESVRMAYQEMIDTIEAGFAAAVNENLSWQQRSLRFGSVLHTIQDSYCTAHAQRIDNGDPASPLIDMYTYPSRHHPLTTVRDGVWQDKNCTAFKPEAAAAIHTTVEALKFFVRQSLTGLDLFMDTYFAFRPDIKDL
ncbi:MAG: hypothetical protein L0154_27730 [Chloroflexi bacterium]|nr:hypothetical protein [Chloroflexota bacterium]